MKTTYDKSADAVYITFKEGQNFELSSSTKGDWPFHVDQNSDGEVIGIEVMEASSIFNQSFLDKCEKL